jgi:hypothetical protein
MLSPFNLGTAAQRVSPELWQGVLWDRMFVKNASGILGAALLLAPFVFATSVKVRSITVVATALSLLPLLVFTNLHLVHDYYQTANMLYLFFAISVAATSAGGPEVGLRPALVATALIVASNLIHLRSEDQLKIGKRFDKTSRDVAIGAVLKRELAEEGQFVAFGNDWSSTFGYLSERKSFTVPVWLPALHEVAARPQDFVEKDRLGAVVACATGVPSLPDLVAWSAKDGRNWKIGRTHECLIATPQVAPPSVRPGPSSASATSMARRRGMEAATRRCRWMDGCSTHPVTANCRLPCSSSCHRAAASRSISRRCASRGQTSPRPSGPPKRSTPGCPGS